MENEKRLIDVNDALDRLRKAEPNLKVVSIVGVKAVSIDAFIHFLESRKTVDAVEGYMGGGLTAMAESTKMPCMIAPSASSKHR